MQKLILRLLLVSFIVIVLTGLFLSTNLLTSAKTQGLISIPFDDGTQNQYDNAYPLLYARGMNATYYIITKYVNTATYMSVAELQTLQNSGSEIGSHSVTHPDFTSLTDAQLQNESQLSKQTLQSWGLSINDFAYPYGLRNNHTDSIVAKYYQTIRSAYAGPYIIQYPTSQFLLPGFPGETGDSTALSKVESMVDQVSSSNGWCIIFFHNVLPNPTGNFSISSKNFASFLDYVSSKGIRTLTVNQALSLQVAINPSLVNMYVGQSVTFNASVSGGSPPYSYKWYLNNNSIASSTSASFAFVPAQAGITRIYLNVADSTNTLTQSNIANVQVYNQYPLSLSNNSGMVLPSNGQYNESSKVSITAKSLVAKAGERYTWLGWVGTGTGSYTGMNNPAQVEMNGAITESAQWDHQYMITLTSSGLSSDAFGTTLTVGDSIKTFDDLPTTLWIDNGSSLNFMYIPTISSTTANKQFVLTSVNASSPLVINDTTTVVATYKIQYYMTVDSLYGTTTGSGWYDSGTNANIALYSSTITSFPGTQYIFTGWSPSDSSSIAIASNDTSTTANINGPGVITANFDNTQTIGSTTSTTVLTSSPTSNPTPTPFPTKTFMPSNSSTGPTPPATNYTPVPTYASLTPIPSPNPQTVRNVSMDFYDLVVIVSTIVVLFPITVIYKKRRRVRFN